MALNLNPRSGQKCSGSIVVCAWHSRHVFNNLSIDLLYRFLLIKFSFYNTGAEFSADCIVEGFPICCCDNDNDLTVRDVSEPFIITEYDWAEGVDTLDDLLKKVTILDFREKNVRINAPSLRGGGV